MKVASDGVDGLGMMGLVRERGLWERSAELVARLKSCWPESCSEHELVATLQVLFEGVLAGVELRSSGLVDRGFAWAKVRLRAIGCDPERLAVMTPQLVELLVEELGEPQRGLVAGLLDGVPVYLRHVSAKPDEDLHPGMVAGQPGARLLAAMLSGDRITVRSLLLERADASQSLDERLEPAMRAIGALWQRGKLTPAQEHIASRLSFHVVQELVARGAAVPLLGRPAAYMRCLADEHCFGQLCLQIHCQAVGVSLVPLPPADNLEDLMPMLVGLQPATLLIGCGTPRHLLWARSILASLRRKPEFARLSILLGGGVFDGLPQLATQLGASAPAASGREVAKLLAGWCHGGQAVD